MASAPSGTGAPVMIRAAFPSVIGQVGTLPAGITSVTSKVTGCSGEAAAVSTWRSAYPSYALFAKEGTGIPAVISSARIRSKASCSKMYSVG